MTSCFSKLRVALRLERDTQWLTVVRNQSAGGLRKRVVSASQALKASNVAPQPLRPFGF